MSHGCTCTHQQIEEDVVAQEERTYRLGSQHPECQHGHNVTFAAADFAAILQGDSVTNESTTTGQVGEMPTPHHHDVTLTCSPDADNDDVADDVELSMGTDPNDADSDDDGAPDAEVNAEVDTDGDGLINALDPDSDDDGLFDGTELGLGCEGPGTAPAMGHCIPDGDAGLTMTDMAKADTDEGGALDGEEDADHDGVVDAGETDPNDPMDDVP